MSEKICLLKTIHRKIPIEARVMPPLKEIESLLNDERGNLDARERQLYESALGKLYEAVAWRRTREMARIAAYPEGGAPE